MTLVEFVAVSKPVDLLARRLIAPYCHIIFVHFQVAAENEVGLGAFKELTKGVAPKSGFGELLLGLYTLFYKQNN